MPVRKNNLFEAVSRKAHLTKKASKDAVEVFLSEIQKALIRGEKVVLSGFGTFRSVSVKDKEVIIPKTGERKIIKSHRAARFTPGRSLKKMVRG